MSEQKDFSDLRQRDEVGSLSQQGFFAAVLENMNAGVVACNEKGELVLFNQVARDWHGLSPLTIRQEEWAGQYDLYREDGVTPMDINTIPLARAFRGETIHDIGMVIAAKGQPKRSIVTHASPVMGENGRILGAVAVMHDITQRKLAEESLKDSEERLKVLFEFAPDGYYLFNKTGTFLDGNKMAEALSGYRREELIGKSFLKLHLMPLSQIPKAVTLLARSLEQPTGPEEFTLIRKDGTQAEVEIKTYPIGMKGDLVVLGIARDITERKQIEELNKERIAKIEQFNKICIDREIRIVELKKEIEALKAKLGK